MEDLAADHLMEYRVLKHNVRPLIKESWAIEKLPFDVNDPTNNKIIDAHVDFVLKKTIVVEDIETLVSTFSDEGYPLRRKVKQNVRVGEHIAPLGGEEIPRRLGAILETMPLTHPLIIHQEYLYLHPFIDGNGRSARALFFHHCYNHHYAIWHNITNYGFLHYYYYLTLQEYDKRKKGK